MSEWGYHTRKVRDVSGEREARVGEGLASLTQFCLQDRNHIFDRDSVGWYNFPAATNHVPNSIGELGIVWPWWA